MAVAPACRGRRLRPWRRGRGGGTSPPLLLLPLLLVLLKLACLRRRSSSSILAVLFIAWEPIAILVLLAQPGESYSCGARMRHGGFATPYLQ